MTDATGTDLAGALPRTTAVLQQGITDGLHLGAIVHVFHQGKVAADGAIGEARPGMPMTPEQLVIWWSMTKPSVAVAMARLWEAGEVGIDDPVARFIPEFAANGKEAVTVRHCLTHTGGFRDGDQVRSLAADPDEAWDETTTGICAVALEPGWVPGRKAGYHLGCSMHILGEIVARVTATPFRTFVLDEVFLPLGMDECHVGMSAEQAAAFGDRIGTMYNTDLPEPMALDIADSPAFLLRSVPGGGGRGPMRQLALLYRMLLGEGQLDGTRILSPQTVSAITARHRTGMHDETFGVVMDWGLGFAIDTGAMGRHCSPRAFGHGGAQSSQAMADPEHDLVAVVQTNGMCGNERHYQRLDAVWSALYEDLGLADPDAPGRTKPLPGTGMASA